MKRLLFVVLSVAFLLAACGEDADDSVVERVMTGGGFSCVLNSDGTLSFWGFNSSGQFGNGTQVSSLVPLVVSNNIHWRTLDLGIGAHVCAISTKSELSCWGDNFFGQLGDGTPVQVKTTTTPLDDSNDWLQVSVGEDSSCAIKKNGTLYCWGGSAWGYIPEQHDDTHTPHQLGVDSDWRHVEVGGQFACALKENNDLYCWGYNTSGKIGNGGEEGELIHLPVKVGSDIKWDSIALGNDSACGIDVDGVLFCWGSNVSSDPMNSSPNTPLKIGKDNDWRSVAVGVTHMCAIKKDNRLYCWGGNTEGQLGLGGGYASSPALLGLEQDWKQVDAGYMHTCAMKLNGDVYCWGYNEEGQLGLGNKESQSVPMLVEM